MAAVLVDAMFTFTDTLATVVGSGNLAGARVSVVGPRFVPAMMKIEPWAMLELGNPAGAQLAAFTIPPLLMTGCARQAAAETQNNAYFKKFIDPPQNA